MISKIKYVVIISTSFLIFVALLQKCMRHQMKSFGAGTQLPVRLLRLAGVRAPCCYCLWPSTPDGVAADSMLLCNQEKYLGMEEENPARCQNLTAGLRSHAASEQKPGVDNGIQTYMQTTLPFSNYVCAYC